MLSFNRTNLCLASAAIEGLLVATSAWAEKSPRMKMTTPIPEKVTTPASIESRLGTLEFLQGFPTEDTADKLY